jgi:hypothetical protein
MIRDPYITDLSQKIGISHRHWVWPGLINPILANCSFQRIDLDMTQFPKRMQGG